MKVENRFNYNDTNAALKVWACGLYEDSPAIGGILDTIPWTSSMEKVLPWDSVEMEISDTIGPRPEFSAKAIIMGDEDECVRLAVWANKKTQEIADTYKSIIDRINQTVESQLTCVIFRTAGVHNGVVKYEEVTTFSRSSVHEIAEAVASLLFKNKAIATSWNINDLHDAIHKSFRDNSQLHLGTDGWVSYSMLIKKDFPSNR